MLNLKSAFVFLALGSALPFPAVATDPFPPAIDGGGNEALRIDPAQADALVRRATSAMHERRYADAERDYAVALASSPDLSAAWTGLITAKTLLRRYDEALDDVAAFQRAKAVGAGDAAAMKGQILFAARRYPDALSQLDIAMDQQAGGGATQRLRAKTRAKLGDKAGALADYDAAISNPSGLPHEKAAMLLERAQLHDPKDRSRWEQDLAQAAKLNGGPSAAIAMTRGVMEQRGGNSEAARMAFLRAQTLGRKDPAMGEARLLAMKESGFITNDDEVMWMRRDLRGREGSNHWLHNNVCWQMAMARIKVEEAMPYCERAIALTRGKLSYRDSKAMLLLTLGQTDESIAAYDEILEIDPKMASSLYGRALAKLAKGETAAAQADVAAARAAQYDVDDQFREYGREFPETARSQAQ